ncbi:MAG: hypothetical protein ACOX6T_08585 [Myxococcales bacterium]|jgi:beta propeller repeat protein
MSRARLLASAAIILLPVGVWAAQPSFSGTETRITSAAGSQYDPRISGDLIVYTDFSGADTDIWYYDLSTGAHVQVTSGRGDQELTDVSEGLIAYSDYETADVVVYATLSGEFENLTASANAISINPAIGGRIVAWEDRRHGNTEIYARHLDTGEERRIDSPPGDYDLKPAVADGIIVWQACSPQNICDIWAHDWATGASRAITSTPLDDERFADVDNGRVVYDGLRGADRDIFLFDLRTGEELRLELPGEQIYPNISGDFVAFEELVGDGYHIRLWHPPSGAVFDVTGNEGYQFLNDIDGNRIVYTDDRNGHLDIYMFEFEVTFSPPAVVDCANVAGAEPLVDVVFQRTTGSPNDYLLAFSAPDGPGLVCVENPSEGAFPVTSATLTLNFQTLLRPSDFPGDVPRVFELRPTLWDWNLLSAHLAGKPGSAMRVRVYALDVSPSTGASEGSSLRAGVRPRSASPKSAAKLSPGAFDSPIRPAAASLVAMADDVPLAPQGGADEVGALAPVPAYGCSQSGPGHLVPAALVAALFALLVRPSMSAVRARRRR